ncbi:MAG: universal stress protein [Verrucomicrobia bacterium]|nr:universal stress protein [Verrucomicrobiota bacterium]
MKTILVPVDLSPAAARVCDAACALAKLTGARLVLMHVTELAPIVVGDLYAVNAAFAAEAATAAGKYAARRLEVLARQCARRGVEAKTVQCTDLPVTAIIGRAKSLRAAYIVIGSHGHGAVYDLVAGSTTHGVLRKARCPVLVVPIAAEKPRGKR